MHAAVAAEGDEGEITRISTAVGGHRLHRAHHIGVGDGMDAVRGFHQVAAERSGDLLDDRAAGVFRFDLDRTARERRLREIAEHHVRVGHRRRLAPLAVAGRSRHRAGTFRADLEGAGLVDPDDGAATRSDLGDVDRRQFQRIATATAERAAGGDAAADLEFVGAHQSALLDDRRLRGGSAHVEGDEVGIAAASAELPRRDDAGGRAAFDDLRRPVRRRRGIEDPTARLHDHEAPRQAGGRQILDHGIEIALHRRADIGVDHRRARPLVLANFRQHVDGERDEGAGHGGAQHLAHPTLVRRIGVGMQEADGDSLNLHFRQAFDRPHHVRLVECGENPAGGVHPLGDLQPAAARHQGRRFDVERFVEPGHANAAQLQNVAKAARGQ